MENQEIPESPSEEKQGELAWGRHVALAALEGEGSVNKVWALRALMDSPLGSKIRQLAKSKGAVVSLVEKVKLDQLTQGENHQGIVVSAAAHQYADLSEVIEASKNSRHPLLLVLDGIEDPHNLGALIRTAVGAGAQGVIIPQRRAVGLTGIVEKSSAGSLDRMPVARVGNLNELLKKLQKEGFWIVAADSSGKSFPYTVDLTVPVALVIGGEGGGISRLVLDNSDFVVRLPMVGDLESLNASVAGGVLMYEILRQRLAQDPSMARE